VNADIARHQSAIHEICRRHRVRRLDLFGSAATGRFRPGESDFDFLVEFEPMPPGGYADAYFGLLEALTELLGRPVDLVVAPANRNPYFRESVEETRTPLVAA
jgi:predicted nucleotidyltransferase